jgi:hypothetical protein
MARDVSLQKRHFEFLANAILDLRSVLTPTEHRRVAEHFAYRLHVTNPNFSTERFLDWSLGIAAAKIPGVRKRPAKTIGRNSVIHKEPDDGGYWE